VWAYEGKRAFARYFASLLRSLGYRSRLRLYTEYFEGYRSDVADSRTRAQIGIEGWAPDFGAASNFTPLFVCKAFIPRSPDSTNLAEFCDRGIDARIEEARAAPPAQADAIWRDVYDRLADAAPAVPLVNDRNVTFVSERVGNYQFHPMSGPLFDQMWVR
jgi:peptide/nickel transport system substrate-binding protein